MELTIYTYGYGEVIYQTLQGIAMIRNSAIWPGLIKLLALFMTFYYALLIARGNGIGAALNKWFGMLMLTFVMLKPTTTMQVVDNINPWRTPRPVANIPLVFALPVGMIEHYGHLITMAFEQAFTKIKSRTSFNYYEHGTVFGARLASEVMQHRLRDPEVLHNLRGFIQQCVVLPAKARLGGFNKEELIASKDAWGYIKSKAGTIIRFNRIQKGKYDQPTCQEGISYFEAAFDVAIQKNITNSFLKFAGIPDEKDMKQNISNKFKNQLATLYGTPNQKVEDILKHNMMLHALSHSSRFISMAGSKATMQHEAGGLLSKEMGEQLLVVMLAVKKSLTYASFLFIVPMLLLVGGMGKYKNYLLFCWSLQLWPPLFVILNMFMDIGSDPAHIVSYSSWASATAKFDRMVGVAGGLSLFIPFLAMWATKMGEGGFMHLAGSVMANAQGAVSAASAERASGSMSYDNESIGNRSFNNTSGNKHDEAMQFARGGFSQTLGDGTVQKVTAGGQMVYSGGAGTTSSTGESSYRESNGLQTSIHNSLRDEMSASKSTEASLSSAQEKMISQEIAALKTLGESTRTEDGFNLDTSTEGGKELHDTFSKIDRFTEGNDFTWVQKVDAYAKAHGSLSGSFSLSGLAKKALIGAVNLVPGVEARAGVEVGGGISAENSSQQSDLHALENQRQDDMSTRNSNSERTSNHQNYLESKGLDLQSQEQLRETYNEVERLEEVQRQHQDKIKGYTKLSEHVENHSQDYSKDNYQEVLERYQEKYGVGSQAAQAAVSAGTSEAQEVFRELSQEKAEAMLQKIHHGRDQIASQDNSQFVAENQAKLKSGFGNQVEAKTKEYNLQNAEQTQAELERKGTELAEKHHIKQQANEDRQGQWKGQYDYERGLKAKNIEKYEEDRIGKGKTAQNTINVVNRITGNRLGEIGRSDDQKVLQNFRSNKNDEPIPEFEPISRILKPERPTGMNHVDRNLNKGDK